MNDPLPIPETMPELIRYFPQADLVWLVVQLFALGIPLFFLFTGFGAALRARCVRTAGGRWYLSLTLFACAYLILSALIALPLGYFADIGFRQFWNAPVPSLPQWLAGRGVELISTLGAASVLLWIPYWLIRVRPRTWWLWTTLLVAPALMLALIGFKVWGAPQHPLDDPDLSAKIAALAARCGVSHVPVFVGGSDTTVVGMGPTKRILLPDDFGDLTPPEQLVSVAHELKHYLLDDWKALGLILTLLLIGLWLVNFAGRAMIRRHHMRFGFSDLADPASLPLVIFTLSAAWLFVGLPVYNAVQRQVEFEADRFAIELTHQNHAQGLLQTRFSKYKLTNEYWFYKIWRDNHPSQAVRVGFANTYHPWAEGKPLVYANVCRMSQ